MRLFIIILTLMYVAGCKNSGNDAYAGRESLDDMTLTGTWAMVNETETYKDTTDEYLYSTFIKETYILEETDDGVKYETCRRYGGGASYGIKTSEHFYMAPEDNGFRLIDDNVLQQESEYTNSWEPEFYYKSIATLTKVSDLTLLDSGTLIVNGPISIEEYNHVCVWSVAYSIGVNKAFEIISPFDDDYITLRISIYGDVAAGSYQYTKPYDNSPVRIDISSNATEFYDIVGSNTLVPSDVSINLIEFNDAKISGTYSFTGQDDGSYSGEFELFL